LTENRLNDIASAAIFQHERRFPLPLGEFERTIHNAKWCHGPPKTCLLGTTALDYIC